MTLTSFNQLPRFQAFAELMNCCGSQYWADKLADERPFSSLEELIIESDRIWESATKEDILEAFSHHPKIGDLNTMKEKFASTKEWASNEQAGVQSANEQTLVELAKGNQAYEKKFGFIFIVCATGKSAEEMLTMLNARIHNQPDKEIQIAAQEQNKITHLRLKKLFK